MKYAGYWPRTLTVVFALLTASGCASDVDIKRETVVMAEPLAQVQGESIFNVRRIYGVAIGVSFYSPSASSVFPSLPAHALSAGMMVDTLYRSYTYRRESALGKMRLVTDLRLKVGDPANLGILNRLSTAIGVDSITKSNSRIWPGATFNRDGTWPYFGNNLPISKARIESAIGKSIAEMREGVEKEGTIAGLIYVSAHGILGTDNIAHIIPGDGAAADSATWAKLSDLLRPIYEFAAEGGNQELTKRIVVIDAVCQRGGRGGLPIPAPPRGVAVMLSASPGQYAWHFISKEQLREKIQVNNSEPTINEAYQLSKMSYLPISLRRSLAELGVGLPPVETAPGKDSPTHRRNISVETLVESVKKQMIALTETDPLVKQTGGQDVAVAYGEGTKAMNFLTLINAGNVFREPREKMDWGVLVEEVL